jgi:hypothetical protein
MKANAKQAQNNQHTPPNPICSIHILLREIPPARFLVICYAGDAGPDMPALQVRHLQRCVRKAADSYIVLLE